MNKVKTVALVGGWVIFAGALVTGSTTLAVLSLACFALVGCLVPISTLGKAISIVLFPVTLPLALALVLLGKVEMADVIAAIRSEFKMEW